VCDLFFFCQELIDVLAVNLKQVLAISDSNNHGVEFIRIERKKETGKADEIGQVLPKTSKQKSVRFWSALSQHSA
jgi:hypothetical protein